MHVILQDPYFEFLPTTAKRLREILSLIIYAVLSIASATQLLIHLPTAMNIWIAIPNCKDGILYTVYDIKILFSFWIDGCRLYLWACALDIGHLGINRYAVFRKGKG